MKLGICYMVFDGEELLEFAVKSIRNEVDYVSVTYQDVSYFGNPAHPELRDTLEKMKSSGLVDELIYYHTDLSIHHKENELRLRNIGLEASRLAGCTHHISSDVDELYTADQLRYAKNAMDKGGYDFSMAPYVVYYKHPTFLVYPPQPLSITLIHPVTNIYQNHNNFPFRIEPTRRLAKYDNYKTFNSEEITVHHMSFVRKDIRKKFANSDNAQYYRVNEMIKHHDSYKLGDRVCLLPDYMNRRTIKVENIFGIEI
jgi:hypothetical protein